METTQTVFCRKLAECDLEMVMHWRMQPEITKYLNTDPTLTLEGQKAWFASLKQRQPFYNWIISVSGQDAGVIQIVDYNDKECEWGYYIAVKSARSVALAVSLELSLYDFIFSNTSVNKIYARSFVKNASVIRLHELCGCETESILQNNVQKNGEWFDVAVQFMSRAKWYSLKEKMDYQSIHFE